MIDERVLIYPLHNLLQRSGQGLLVSIFFGKTWFIDAALLVMMYDFYFYICCL